MRDQDTVKGMAHKTSGKVKKAVGNMTGDTEIKAEGMAEQARGTVQEGMGKTKEAVRGAARGLGGRKRVD